MSNSSSLEPVLESFCLLGDFFRYFTQKEEKQDARFEKFRPKAEEAIINAGSRNPWFTRENILYAMGEWGRNLRGKALAEWLSPYHTGELSAKENPVGIVMAGNIPLVGFHDFLCVLASGNRAVVKPSSTDTVLWNLIADFFREYAPQTNERFTMTDAPIKAMSALIATGSDNTARYFEYYFRNIPSLIRQSRHSVAVLTGEETSAQLEALADDIMLYFGLGCRSVSKLFVPEGYDFVPLIKALEKYDACTSHHRYMSNYTYNRAMCALNPIGGVLDTGFLMIAPGSSYGGNIGQLLYETYTDEQAVYDCLGRDRALVQCMVGHSDRIDAIVPFGEAQCPALDDYADGIDTMKFLTR